MKNQHKKNYIKKKLLKKVVRSFLPQLGLDTQGKTEKEAKGNMAETLK